MKNQVLNIEQMQELIDMGVDVSKASMCWIGCSDGNDVYLYNSTFKDIFENHRETIPAVLTPAFTLQDILKILPKKIDGGGWVLSERYSEIPGEEEGAYMWYGRKKVGITNGYTPLTAAFNMLKWCKENKYI